MSTLGTELPNEIARCRELLVEYRGIGPAGAFGAAMIEATIRAAEKSMAEGDLPEMIRCFKALQECG